MTGSWALTESTDAGASPMADPLGVMGVMECSSILWVRGRGCLDGHVAAVYQGFALT